MVKKGFIEVYSAVGYYLRNLDINTSSRVAMLSSMIHLQKGDKPVEFKKFYDFSIENTDEKLEKSSFGTLVKKLHDAEGSDQLVMQGDTDKTSYYASKELLNKIDQAKAQFSKLTDQLVEDSTD